MGRWTWASLTGWCFGFVGGIAVMMTVRPEPARAEWGYLDMAKLERGVVALESIARDLKVFAEQHRRANPPPPPTPTPISQATLDRINRWPDLAAKEMQCRAVGGRFLEGVCGR